MKQKEDTKEIFSTDSADKSSKHVYDTKKKTQLIGY